MPTLHQFVPTLDPGAVGAHLLEIQRTMRSAGWESEVFSEHTKPPYDGLAHRFTDYGRNVPARPDDIVVYHAAIGSSVADWLMTERPPRLVLDYHNITPPSWFDGWEPDVAYGLSWGRAQLRRLARRARYAMADSAYNAEELNALGMRRTAVLPILVPADALTGAPDRVLLDRLSSRPGAKWLFVSRLAPNKRQHLLLAALAVFRRVYDPNATLALVGSASSSHYEDALHRYAEDLGIADAVTFAGGLNDSERNAHYAAADVFVGLSGHEGFAVPFLEAWHHRLPIVTHAAAAVPETVGPAAIVLPTTEATVVAAAVARVCGDRGVADGLRIAGLDRLEMYSLPRAQARLLELADALAGGLADRPVLLRRSP